jgi:hypothetical protein
MNLNVRYLGRQPNTVNTAENRLNKFNETREQVLKKSQERGFNARMNQTLSSINSVRKFIYQR